MDFLCSISKCSENSCLSLNSQRSLEYFIASSYIYWAVNHVLKLPFSFYWLVKSPILPSKKILRNRNPEIKSSLFGETRDHTQSVVQNVILIFRSIKIGGRTERTRLSSLEDKFPEWVTYGLEPHDVALYYKMIW